MVVDNMRKQREGSTDGKNDGIIIIIILWKCKVNIREMYGEH